MRTRILFAAMILLSLNVSAKKIKKEVPVQVHYGTENTGTKLEISFEKGKYYNHPLFAIWMADEDGKYIQTLYVSESIGKGTFKRADRNTGKWMPGEIQRPASLPFWAHNRGIKNEYGTYMPTPRQPEVDAYTGATPPASFILNIKTEKPLVGKYKIMLELNQSWDWNDYWHNAKFPDDKEYKTSSQPALVYAVEIDTAKPETEYTMNPLGHSHYARKDGSINTDLKTITTALQIAKRITVKIK